MATNKILDLQNLLENSDLWKVLTPEQRESLQQNVTLRPYRKNEVIYHEDDLPTHLLCVLNGKVKIYREGSSGRSQIVRIIMPGELFGYRALFAKEKYITTAAAFESCTISSIPEAYILNLIRQNADLAFAFIRFLSIDLGIMDARTIVLTQNHIRGRLAEAILHIKDNYGCEEDGKTLVLRLSREDLASFSNMTTANAIRTLSQFDHEGLVQVEGRCIRILQENELRKIVQLE